MGAYLGIETGGTSIRARLIDQSGRPLRNDTWPTTTGAAAISAITEFAARDNIAGIGVAAFGPICVDPSSDDYGVVGRTPKPGWCGTNLYRALTDALDAPVMVDTDVNAAALAERLSGAGKGLKSLAYVTVGTGIGAGLATAEGTLKGALHPEMGHVPLRRAEGDHFESVCPFHADCVEGLASGTAIAARLGANTTLGTSPETLNLIARYFAQLAFTITLAWSPHAIVIGGGVLNTVGLLDAIRTHFTQAIGDYGLGPAVMDADFLRPPALSSPGLEGALLMARAAGGATP